jgi:tRNA nucleotidyltransferase (CCA-adding enzyme)
VFLHPQSHEEYALPRGGQDGGDTLEADLQRRDLTINAMAMDGDGNLIDPCDGKRDLERRILRHTAAFRDDPVRLLRLARFAARYHALGFRIAEETLELCRQMVAEGDLDELVPERVFAEIARALQGKNPPEFFLALRACNALAVIMPELERLFGVPQPPEHHPEIDSGIHTLLVLEQACRLSEEPEVRFAALLHDLGKGATPPEEWPRHIAHEERGVKLINALCKRLRVPNRWRELAVIGSRYHLRCHRALEMRNATLHKMLTGLDVQRRSERFQQLLLVCEADMRGRTGFEERDYPQGEFLRGLLKALTEVDTRTIATACEKKAEIPQAIHRAQLEAIAVFQKEYKNSLT